MRWAFPSGICIAAIFLSGALARDASDVSIRIGEWTLRPHFSEQQDKKQRSNQLDRCSAQLTNANKITMTYSIDTHYMWTFELSSPSWNFPTGSKFDISFGSPDGGFFRERVAALDPQLVRVLLSDSVNFFESFRRLVRLDLIAGGLTTQFDLSYADQVLFALTQCVTKFGTTAKRKSAVSAWIKSPFGPVRRASRDPDPTIMKETAALAAAIIAEANFTNASALKPNEVPDDVNGDAVWKIADNLFTVSVLPSNVGFGAIGDVNDLFVSSDAQKCAGDFFAGATLNMMDTVTFGRAYTTCQTQHSTKSTYYFSVPRKQGGLYFTKIIASGVEMTPTIERVINDLDVRLRTVFVPALANL